ncbi:uncharacterized protein F5Z01DRAFT_488362 [Emericellopsis atlantica]|uniref:Uncharacterized protein n=1 Tax=Emericellopsis atlantica TaxID=2614577 RepID=A0A9P7ZSB5_9HYPO|nr:uncharacterized protein F5Z01DRAFT_488362 [Emericellopsis atlantica]KAG9256790.1 hypothetical protein F5Z01DRAFT_488362 [Emericellopsis atlantica]
MFIHAGAGLHGHEFSRSPTESDQAPKRPIPLLRSALRPLAEANTRYPLPSASPDFIPERRSYTDPAPPPQLPRRPASEAVTRKELAVRFQEPTMAPVPYPSQIAPSEDEESIAESELSGYSTLSGRRKRQKRTPRPATKYSLAHPAPQRKTKQRVLIQFRPKNLLQLQKIDDRRAMPAFDVLPSSTISGPFALPRLAKRCPRIFKTKPVLGTDDVLIARSEDYSATMPSSTSADGRLEDRDLLGVVSPMSAQGDDAVEIVMADGTAWGCKPLQNGSFEFSRVDDCGLKTVARWARKPTRTAALSVDGSVCSSSTSPVPREETWTFSVIDPSTRRHPIMGMLTPRELAIYDTYSTLQNAGSKGPPTKPFPPSATGLVKHSVDQKQTGSAELVPEELKDLMVVTACWVGIRLEGWPASLHPKALRSTASPQATSSDSIAQKRRTYPLASPPTSPAEIPSRMSSPNSCDYDISSGVTSPTSPVDVPKRAMSTGAAFMRRRQSEQQQSHYQPRTASLAELPMGAVGALKGVHRVNEEVDDGKTASCRIKVRQLTCKLFRRRSCRVT